MFIIRVIERLSQWTGGISAILVIPLILALGFEVFSRYVLGIPTAWAYEISYMLMGSIFMFSMARALKDKQHVNVDIIYASLSSRGKAVVDLVGYSIFLIAVWWMTFELFEYSLKAFNSSEVSGKSAWNPVVWPFRAVWFIGFFVLGLQALADVKKAAIVLMTGKEIGGGV